MRYVVIVRGKTKKGGGKAEKGRLLRDLKWGGDQWWGKHCRVGGGRRRVLHPWANPTKGNCEERNREFGRGRFGGVGGGKIWTPS